MENFESISKNSENVIKHTTDLEAARFDNGFSVNEIKAEIEAVKEIISYISSEEVSYEDALAVFAQYKNISAEDMEEPHAEDIYGIHSKDSMIEELKEELGLDEKNLEEYLARNN